MIWFSLDHKRNVGDWVVRKREPESCFSLDHKLYASDYDFDSDSVASEYQPLLSVFLLVVLVVIHLFTSFLDTGLPKGNLHERDSDPMQDAIPKQSHNL